MTERVQFCVALEDRPGMLAALSGRLHRADVNIEALFATQDDRCTWVYLIGSPEVAMRRALNGAGYHFLTEPVLTVQMDNRPGTLETMANRLSEAGVNITYVYGSGPGDAPFTLVLSTSDMARAAQALATFDAETSPNVPGPKTQRRALRAGATHHVTEG